MTQPNTKKRFRIVHVLNSLGMGGVETMCLEVIRHLSPENEHAILVLDAKEQPRRNEFASLGLSITTLDHQAGQYGQLILKSYNYFRQFPTDAVICWSFGNHAFVSLGAKLAGVPRIITSVQNAPPANGLSKFKWQVLAQMGFLTNSVLVACSNYVRDRLVQDLRLPAGKIATIYNGCNVKNIYQRSQATKHLKPNHPVIGMVARLDPIKDQKTLIQAMPLVLANYPQAELWLIGNGQERESLEKISAELGLTKQIIFWGDRFDIPELLGQMDVFAFSTTAAEGFGIVLVEALAAQLPIVASHIEVCTEVLQHGKYGQLVEPANPLQMGKAILHILSGTKQQASLEEIWQLYDTSRTAQEYWQLLQ